MPKYRITSGRHNGHEPGTVVELSERQYRMWDTKFEPAPDDADTAGSDDENAGEETAGFDAAGFVDRNVAPIEDDIEAGEADAHLDDVLTAEQEQHDDPRTTVVEAVEGRKEEV